MSSTRNAEDEQIIYKYDNSNWKKKSFDQTYTYEWLHFRQWYSSITISIWFNQSIYLIKFFKTSQLAQCPYVLKASL
jgi:hypothetical protein